MKYLGNDRNIVRQATLSATNIVASNVVYRTDDAPKAGGGQVSLSGDYVGTADTDIDVKIVDTTITGAPKISAPTFTGIGNGVMSGIAADSTIAAQEFVITLEDLGTATAKAYAPFQGVTLRAKASGTTGNAVTLTVNNSGLSFAATTFALAHDLQQGTNEYTGDEWDFGAAILNADLTIPDAAPRISFAHDPQIYRAYKFYRGGHYVYGFSPAPVRSIAAGAIVKLVTGSRSITVANGGTSDTMTGISSVYDALSAIRTHSTLVDVIGAIVNDKTAGGQGATDLSAWTSAYLISQTASGSEAALHADFAITPAATAPTETLSIQCTDGTIVGGETWQVRGNVSGRLADAITGALYANGGYSFEIPPATIGDNTPTGTMTVEFVPTDAVRASMPTLCAVHPLIGSAGRAGTWRFVYAKRPATLCDCTTGALDGSPDDDCLGITEVGGDMSNESRLIRLQRLTTQVRSLIGKNTYQLNDVNAYGVNWIDSTAAILKKCLDAVSLGTLVAPVWTASTVLALDVSRSPTVVNGYRYIVTTAGTTGSSQPTWPTTIGSTVGDGSVTWTCVGKTPFLMWDDIYTQWANESAVLLGRQMIAPAWTATSAPPAAGFIRPTFAHTTGHVYKVDFIPVSGVTGGTEPTWPTASQGGVKDGDLYWRESYQYWAASTAKVLGDTANPGDGFEWVVTTAGTTGGSEPNWYTSGNTVTDGGVTWTRKLIDIDSTILLGTPSDQFLKRYQSMCDDALAAAGVDPNFKDASTEGDGCWHDFDDSDHWFVYQGDAPYLPIQPGHYYHSAQMLTGSDGNPTVVSTKEFGFGPKFGCPENLKEGDVIKITIGGVGVNSHGYQAGDTFTASIVHAEAVPFGGGQTGNDTLTFSVVGSIAGRRPDYALITTALAAYSDSGHLGFSIVPGGIDFALGDSFRFKIEGGHFEWRRDGGSWSSAIAIASAVVLADGLSVNFAGGNAPSWVVNDQWSFTAEAVNGVDGLRQPTDARCQWAGSTTIVVDPGATDSISGILIADHTIDPTATITLQGSDDNFATTPFSQVIPWKLTHINVPLTGAKRAKYRLTVNKAGSIQWLHLGDPFQGAVNSGAIDAGKLIKRRRMPSIVSRRSLHAQIEHAMMSQASADALDAMLSHACEFDDGRIAIVPNDADDDVGIVKFAAGTLEMNDVLAYQSSAAVRLISVSLTLEATP
jgi:hypothetical protein